MNYEKEIEKLKMAEKETAGPGCIGNLANAIASGLVVIIVIVVLAILASLGNPATAVPVSATAILGPTELVLAATPTLRPSSTPAVITAVLEPAPGPTAVATQTPAPTYTPWPTDTPAATYTAAPTYTPWPTFTPYPTTTAAPLAVAVDQFTTSKTELNRITLAVVALATISGLLLLLSFRPKDSDLRRIQKLLEMQLMAALSPAPAAKQLAQPAPVRTTPLSEHKKKRAAPVQNTGVTGGVTGVTTAPPETITVTVAPVADDDPAVLAAIWDLWQGMDRPSMNAVCQQYFGSKNSDRLALVRRAIRWGESQESGGDHGSV